MAHSGSRVLLISRAGAPWIEDCKRALARIGVEATDTYSCWAGEVVLGEHEREAIVIDGHVLCETVSAKRPGPILGRSPETPVVVFNAKDLDDEHRDAAVSRGATLVEAADVAEIARMVGDRFSASA